MNSCSRKRPTRVPESIVVRMNSASNMIAKWYQYASRPCMPGSAEKICAMPTASDTAPPVRPIDFFADRRFDRRHVDRHHLLALEHEVGVGRRRHVDGEVVAGGHRRGGDQRHDADEALDQHRAVADRPDVGFLVDHLRRGAGADQRVEARDGATRDGDEAEREQRSRDDRPAAAANS